MHPSYVSDKPGDCPICGMKLVPRGQAAERQSARGAPAPSGRPAGPAVEPSRPRARQLLGIAQRAAFDRTARSRGSIRTVGRVAVDERRLHHIHIKYDGYVEHLLRRLHRQVREARRAAALDLQPGAGGDAAGVPARLQRAAADGGERHPLASPRAALDLLEAARQRLLLWDIRAEDIEALESAGKVGAHARPALRGRPATWSRRWPSTACGSRPPTRSSTSPTSRTSGSWPTSTSPTCRSVRVGMRGELTRALPARPELARPASRTSTRPSRRRRAPSRSGSSCRTRASSSSPTCSPT